MLFGRFVSTRSLLAASSLMLFWANTVLPVHGQEKIKERPPTQDLLPETTVGFLQIDNFRDFQEKVVASATGQLLRDEAIAPLANGLWEEGVTAYDEIKDKVGLEISDIQDLPDAEVTIAVIAPRRKDLEFMVIVKLNQDSPALEKLDKRLQRVLEEETASGLVTNTTDDGLEYHTFEEGGKKSSYFIHEGLIVACTSQKELDAFVDRWMGREVKKVRPLSKNRKFITIMNRCLGTNDRKPEFRFFVDPIALVKSANRGNVAFLTGMNLVVPALGLDGFSAIGGSVLLAEDEFESIFHTHMLLASPRKGIFEMLSLKATDYAPEPWIPQEAFSVMTTSWDVDQMMAELTKMIENFTPEDTVDNWIEENINANTGIDFKEDFLSQLTGRVTFLQWNQKPYQLASTVTVVAVELKNKEEMESVIETVVAKINEQEDADNPSIGTVDYQGVQIWTASESRMKQRQERRQRRLERRRERRGEDVPELELEFPTPGLAIVGDYLVFSVSRNFVEKAIDVNRGDAPSLATDPKYQRISDEMNRMLKGEYPCMIMYQNPEEVMRMYYDILQSESMGEQLTYQAQNNKYLTGIKRQLEENPLPDFDVIKKYFQPSGAFVTSDETGYHLLAFNLRLDPEESDSDE